MVDFGAEADGCGFVGEEEGVVLFAVEEAVLEGD